MFSSLSRKRVFVLLILTSLLLITLDRRNNAVIDKARTGFQTGSSRSTPPPRRSPTDRQGVERDHRLRPAGEGEPGAARPARRTEGRRDRRRGPPSPVPGDRRSVRAVQGLPARHGPGHRRGAEQLPEHGGDHRRRQPRHRRSACRCRAAPGWSARSPRCTPTLRRSVLITDPSYSIGAEVLVASPRRRRRPTTTTTAGGEPPPSTTIDAAATSRRRSVTTTTTHGAAGSRRPRPPHGAETGARDRRRCRGRAAASRRCCASSTTPAADDQGRRRRADRRRRQRPGPGGHADRHDHRASPTPPARARTIVEVDTERQPRPALLRQRGAVHPELECRRLTGVRSLLSGPLVRIVPVGLVFLGIQRKVCRAVPAVRRGRRRRAGAGGRRRSRWWPGAWRARRLRARDDVRPRRGHAARLIGAGLRPRRTGGRLCDDHHARSAVVAGRRCSPRSERWWARRRSR